VANELCGQNVVIGWDVLNEKMPWGAIPEELARREEETHRLDR
jgi:hypothetical protein